LGQDAVDAFGVRRDSFALDENAEADGQVVWFWRRDAGVKLAGSIPLATVTTSPLTGYQMHTSFFVAEVGGD